MKAPKADQTQEVPTTTTTRLRVLPTAVFFRRILFNKLLEILMLQLDEPFESALSIILFAKILKLLI
jgi:hypothetical protein